MKYLRRKKIAMEIVESMFRKIVDGINEIS